MRSFGNRFTVWSIAGLPLLLTSCSQPQSSNPEQVTEEVRSMVDAHWTAINEGEIDIVNSHHAAGFTIVMTEFAGPFGQDSPEYEELVTTPAAWHWQPGNVDVQPLGPEAAVASFLMSGSTTWPDGTIDNRTRRVTEVWVREGGRWKEAHHHDSVHAPQQRTAQDVEAIRAVVERATEVNNAGDAEGWLELFADDAIFMPDGAPPITGADALRSWVDSWSTDFDHNITIEPLEIDVAGDTGIVRTVITGTSTPTDGGEPIQHDMKEIAVFKRQADGNWKVWRLIGSSNVSE